VASLFNLNLILLAVNESIIDGFSVVRYDPISFDFLRFTSFDSLNSFSKIPENANNVSYYYCVLPIIDFKNLISSLISIKSETSYD